MNNEKCKSGISQIMSPLSSTKDEFEIEFLSNEASLVVVFVLEYFTLHNKRSNNLTFLIA